MAEQATVPVKSGNGAMRRRDPHEMFESIQDEMTRLWSHLWPFGAGMMARPMRPPTEMTTAWSPRTDVFEKDGKLVVKAELPGAKKEDVEVALDQGDLVIRGERKAESEIKEEDYYRMERSYGSFYRRLPLPFEIEADQIQARFADGVLEVQIPKPAEEKVQPRKITVS